MGRTGQIGLARLFVLLAVLLGLLAMHGPAGAHHSAVATPTPSAAAEAGRAPAGSGGHVHHPAVAGTYGHGISQALVAPTCDDGCSQSIAMLCVAILTGASLLPRRHASSPWRLPQPPQQARARAGAQRRPAGPDPVAELCVSRT